VIELAIIIARLAQYMGSAVLLGSSLFFAYALPGSGPGSAVTERWTAPLVTSAAFVLGAAAVLGVIAQASLFAGSWAAGLTTDAISAVVTSMSLGKAALVRAGAALLAGVALLLLWRRPVAWLIAAALGTLSTASLAWMGHGASTEGALGRVHLVSDAAHALAAAVWMGALVAFAFLSLNRSPDEHQARALHCALSKFSGVGSAAVAALVVTGAINSWVLVGPEGLEQGLGSPYARLLALKLLLFAAMLALAAANRWRLTPRFGSAIANAAAPSLQLRRSLAAETALGVGVLGLVAWLGTLEPPGV
jgi:putative copper resistance protein D